MSEPAATTTTGIYCKACGYDLRGSKGEGGAGRCPECGRAFSPDDPKTFRPRPLGEWKRALGRWAKRAAILLLVLALLLGGTWGWFYWGWKEEQAVQAELARMGAESETSFPGEWEKRVGRWAGPAGFVLQRVDYVFWPESATDADLAPLQKLPRLQLLAFYHTRVTDAGLAHLHELRGLKSLSLQETSITGAGLGCLETLPQLEALALQRTAVTDAGLEQVAKLARLRHLWLNGTAITDAGLVHLAKLPALEYLELRGTKVTPAGVAKLRAALPGCRIVGP